MGDGSSQGPLFPYNQTEGSELARLRRSFSWLLIAIAVALFATAYFAHNRDALGAGGSFLLLAVAVRTGLFERLLGA